MNINFFPAKAINGLFAVTTLALAVASTFFGPVAAHADGYDVVHEGQNAIAINNLEFAGTLWNVTFEFGPAESIYGQIPDFPFDNQQDAADAVDLVNTALNSVTVNPGNLSVVTVGPQMTDYFSIGYDLLDANRVALSSGMWESIADSWVPASVNEISRTDCCTTWADFTPVPEPATAWLLVTALLALSGLRRTR